MPIEGGCSNELIQMKGVCLSCIGIGEVLIWYSAFRNANPNPNPMKPCFSSRPSIPLVRPFGSSLLASLTISFAHAADGTWNGTTDGVWATDTNWSATPVPGTGDTATFDNAGNANTTIDLGGAVSISSIIFDTAAAASYTIGAGAVGTDTLTLESGGSITNTATSTQNQFFNTGLVLGSDATAGTYTIASEAQSLIFAGDITGGTGGVADAKILAVGGAKNTQLNGDISDGGATSLALTKSGAGGALTIKGTNTHSGGTTLSAGTLNLGSADSLGTGTFSIAGGSAFNNSSGGALVNAGNNAITLNGGTVGFNGTNSLDLGTGNVTLTATTRINPVGAGGSTLTLGGVIDDGASTFGLNAGGSQFLRLNGDNTYDGNTTLDANGDLVAGHDNAFGNGEVFIQGNGNPNLWLADGVNVPNVLNIDTGINNRIRRLRMISGATTAEWSGRIDLDEENANDFRLNVGAGQTLTISGEVHTIGTRIVRVVPEANNGTYVFSGDNSNFIREFNILGTNATVRFEHDNAAGTSATNSVWMNDTSVVELTDGITIPTALRLTNTNNNKTLRPASGATSAEWAGDVTIEETTANNFDLDADAGQTLTVSGDISGAGGAGVTKGNEGTVILSGTNTYSGGTTVNSGTLSLEYSINDTSKLPDAEVLNLSGGTLDLSGGTHAEVVASTTLGTDTVSSVTRSSGTAVLNMNVITPGAGASVDFGADNIATTDNTNTNGILGTWATVGGTDWASNSTDLDDGLIVAFTGYSDVSRLDSGPKVISNDPTSHVRAIDGTGSTPADLTLGAAVTGIDTLSVSASGGLVTIDPAGQTLELNSVLVGSASGGLTIGNGVSNGVLRSAGTELNLVANAATTINSEIADGTGGASGLLKTGSGTVTLAGANTFSGVTAVGEGILELSNSLALQNSALDTNGSIAGDSSSGLKTTVTTLTLGGLSGGNSLASVFTTSSGGFSGLTELTLNPGSGASSTHSGLISDGAVGMSLVKDGAGTQILSGNNTYTGGTTLNNGELRVNGSTTILGTGALTMNGGTFYKGSGTVTMGNDIVVDGTSSVKVSSGGNLTWNGAITGSGTLNTGGTAPASSLLIADDLSGFTGTITHANVNGDNNLTFSASVNTTAGFSTSGSTSSSRNVSFNAGATIGELSGTGGQMRSSGALIVNQSTSTSYAGVLKNASSAMSLEKQGTGTLTLTGNSIYTGDTTVTAGTMTLADGGRLTFAPTSNGVSNQINGAGTLNLDGEMFLNLGGADTTEGNSWLLVDVGTLSESYGGTFSVNSSLGAFAEAAGVWTLEEGANIWTFEQATGTLSVVAASSPYEDWMAQFTTLTDPADQLPTADPDGDNVDNFTEFAFDGNPEDGSNSGRRHLFTEDTLMASKLVLTVAVRDGTGVWSGAGPVTASSAADGIDYTIDGSVDLATFADAVSVVTPVQDTGLPVIGPDYKWQSFQLDSSAGLTGKGFIRAGAAEAAP